MGFIETILASVIISLICFFGWLAYNNPKAYSNISSTLSSFYFFIAISALMFLGDEIHGISLITEKCRKKLVPVEWLV